MQDLNLNFPIVDQNGNPTQYFIRFLQNRGISQTELEALVQEIIETKADKSTVLTAGVGLSGGGDLSSDRTFDLEDTPVSPGSYTNSNITVDAQGRITAAANGSGGGGGGGGGFFDISMGIPNPLATLGDAAHFTWTQNSTKGANVKKDASGMGPNCAGWIVPKTSGVAWEVAALLLHNNYGSQYYGEQIGLYNSSNSRLITLCAFQGAYNNVEFQRWNSYTNRQDIPTAFNNAPFSQGWQWFHLKDDGSGNIQLGLSKDGANPVWLKTTTTGDWVGSYDNIFFGGFFETNINVPGASSSVLCYDPNGASRLVGA